MKNKLIPAIFLGLILTVVSSAQSRMVSGRLTVFDSFPVENLEIRSKKGKASTLSDSVGRFSIVCMDKDVIKIKQKVFKSVSLRTGPDTDSLIINLIFIDNKKNREIAIGYGYLDESVLSYEVSNVQQQNNDFCHYTDVYELIISRIPGAVIQNGKVILRAHNSIQGINEALYVVDGIVTETIYWIKPCEIASISAIKDGGAAVYGAKGGNGVILIELKKGQ